MIDWIVLTISLILLLVLSRRNLALGMFVAAGFLGLWTVSLEGLYEAVAVTFSDPSILSLAFLVGIIAMVGGILEESGQMKNLIENMRIGKRPFLATSPALFGMLPMPGGSLLTAPMVREGGKELKGETKVAINVWFRHILYLVYPLGPALIASAKVAGLNVYRTIPYLAPFFLLSLLLGYFFFLREAHEEMVYSTEFSPRSLLLPLGVILLAPLADIILKTFFEVSVPEYTTVIGVSLSFLGALALSDFGFSGLKGVVGKMKPWTFSLIVLGMFTFLNVFRASGLPQAIGDLAFPLPVLIVGVSFFLGLATGRIQAPASIIFPIVLARQGGGSVPLLAFALTHFSIFIGYIISPIHPCVSVSIKYFNTSIGSYVKKIAAPTGISILLAALLAVVFLG